MNLIGNSCVSAFIIRDFFKEEFTNPFCWNVIGYESMYNLIKYYDEINFLNFKVIRSQLKNNQNTFSVIIDDKVVVNYIHYKKDESAKSIIFEKSNVIWCDIEKYVTSKYKSRVEKMLSKNENPVFLIAAGYNQEYYYSENELESIYNIDTPYKIIMSYDNCKLKSYNNVTVINHNLKMNVDGVHYKLASFISDKVFNIKEKSTQRPEQNME